MSKCPFCKSVDTSANTVRMFHCNGCGKHYLHDLLDDNTLIFDRLTVSPDVLAEKLVYMSYIKNKLPLTDMRGRLIGYKSVLRQVWKSSVTEETYSRKAEALAATVARLKEVEND